MIVTEEKSVGGQLGCPSGARMRAAHEDHLDRFKEITKAWRRPAMVVAFAAVLDVLFTAIRAFCARGVPFVGWKEVWAISIFEGSSPFDLAPAKGVRMPGLTANNVTDVPARFVADPFLVIDDGLRYLFFEVFNEKTNRGEIGLATSADGVSWKYRQIVLKEPFHMSYPHVFAWDGEHYMIPETGQAASVRLYKATEFPTQWQWVGTLLSGREFTDPSIFRFADKWWLFVSNAKCDVLRLYFADDLLGPWREHPRSPVIERNPHIARPAGRVLVTKDGIYRFAQDDAPSYGRQVRAFEILELTSTSYRERPALERPVLKASRSGWNADGMHHLDTHFVDGRWISSVDGKTASLAFGLQY
jgi:hypothetical protein